MSNSIPPAVLEKFTTFGDLLRFLRRHAGITQLELSIAVGYSDAQISRLEQNLRLPDIPTIEARFVPALYLEDDPRAAARLLELAANVRREDAPILGLSPYKGLSYFDESDVDLFAGREELTNILTARILSLAEGDHRFLAVVGASGSGKSSLVRAGIVPALRWNKASAEWPIYIFTPTAHPLESLSLTLTQPGRSVLPAAGLMDDLARDPRSLHLHAKQLTEKGHHPHLLLVVDQFEELFSLCRSEEEQTAFIDNLLSAATVPDGPVMIVITLRADFYSHCANHARLREALAGEQEYIGAMSLQELRQAIEEPARLGHWEFEPGLVDLLLHDVGHEPGALPLLSHALLETWERRRGRTMTLSGYTASGGVRGAISETAEAVFTDKFTSDQRTIARRIFLRLTELGDETAGGDTRRRARPGELILKPEEADLTRTVLNQLAEARLITVAEDAVEVAHEALIREWPTLRGWLEDNREGLRLHRHLTDAAEEWISQSREPELLYRGARLAQAQVWALDHQDEMNPLEREFVEASLAAREREMLEREEQQRRELETAQRLAEAEKSRAEAETQRAEAQVRNAKQLSQRARWLTAALTIALLMAFIALYFGSQARRTAITAQTERRTATARELAAASLNNLSIDPERSILLALQSVSTTRSVDGTVLPESLEALHQSLVSSPIRKTLQGPGPQVFSTSFSPDGSRLAAIGADGSIFIWDAKTFQEVLRIPGTTTPGDLISANRISYSPDGSLLIAPDRNLVRVYEAASGNLILQLEGHKADVLAIAISPDGKWIASGDLEGTIRLWDIVSGKALHVMTGHTDWIESLAFSPDGEWLVSGGNDAALKVWSVASGDLVQDYTGFASVIDSIDFSPDGSRLTFTDGSLHVWQLDFHIADGQTKISDHELLNIPGAIYVKFSPDGNTLASVSGATEAAIWDAVSGKKLVTLVGHSEWVMGLAFSPDGSQLATTSLDGKVRVWSILPGRETLTVSGPPGNYGTRVTYNPNGREFASNGGSAATIWDASTGEPRLRLETPRPGIMSMAFSPDGKRIATGDLAGSDPAAIAIIWDAASGRRLATLSGHTAGIRDIAFSSDGSLVATGGFDNTARVWDAATGAQLLLIPHERLVLGVAFSPNGTRLATSSTDGNASIWDVKTGGLLFTLASHRGVVADIAFSPDGTKIATASPDTTTRIWDATTGKELLALGGSTSGFRAVAFSPDGRWLAGAGDDNMARIWDLTTGEEILSLPGSAEGVSGVAFSPLDGGAHLAVSSNDGVVRVFTLPVEDLLTLARSRLTRSLTAEECRKYLHLDQCPEAIAP